MLPAQARSALAEYRALVEHDAPETRFCRRPGSSIAYQVVGDGPVDLVFLSAWFSHVDGRWEEPQFARMLRRLSSFARLIVFDRRGSGASDPLPPESAVWEDWADDILAVMDAAGSERAFVAGVGDSGPVAVLFGATHPDRVAGLVLVNTAARFTRAPDYPWGKTNEEVDSFLRHEEETWGGGGLVDVFAPSKAGDAQYAQWWGRYQRMSASPSASTVGARHIFSMDVRPFLSGVQVPTLVVQRSEMPMLAVEHGRYLGREIPGANYVELPGSDYFIYLGEADVLDQIEEFVTGAPSGIESDRVLATVVFTDIVQSTDRAAALGDRRWRDMLDAHDDLVRRKLTEYRGTLVRTTGDGMLATFDGPARAVRSAFAIRNGLRGVGLDLRCGLHTGEVEMRREEIGGIGVHIGARIMSEAEPNEILVSSTVKDLVVGSGIRFEDRGEHELKGVPEQWHLFAAVE